uniref:U650q n=1 Tax=Mycobacterium leprae TaxID=1769 RepID=Q50109_MYCLR|nr:u650q [Mycobacterium leprae]
MAGFDDSVDALIVLGSSLRNLPRTSMPSSPRLLLNTSALVLPADSVAALHSAGAACGEKKAGLYGAPASPYETVSIGPGISTDLADHGQFSRHIGMLQPVASRQHPCDARIGCVSGRRRGALRSLARLYDAL